MTLEKIKKPLIKLTEGSLKARRTAARLASVQVLYQISITEQTATTALSDFIDNRIGYELDGDLFVPADQPTLTSIVKGVEEYREDLQEIVTGALSSRKSGTPPEELLMIILLCGCYEILHHNTVDIGVILNDYMNVTSAFYEGSEPKLINAILDGIAKKIRD